MYLLNRSPLRQQIKCCSLRETDLTDAPVPLVLVLFDVDLERAAVFPVTPTLTHTRRQTSISRLGSVAKLTLMITASSTLQPRLVFFHQQLDEWFGTDDTATSDSDRERVFDALWHAFLDGKSWKEAGVLWGRNETAETCWKCVHVCRRQLHTCLVIVVN